MNSRAIHETVVRDVVDILTDLKDYDEVQFLANRKSARSFKSAAAATKDLILTFPVICSSDIEIENASMICKAIERKCVAMMQMLFSAISITSADNAIDYLKQLHTNINFGSDDLTIAGFVDTFEKAATSLEAADMAEIDHDIFDEVARQLKEGDYYFGDSVSEAAINDYSVYQNGTVACFAEAKSGKQKAYSAAQKRIDYLEDQLANSQAVTQFLQNQRNAANSMLATARDDLVASNDRISRLEKSLNVTTSQLNDARKSGNASAAQIKDLEKQRDKLQKDLETARSKPATVVHSVNPADAAKAARDLAGAMKDTYEALNKQILPTDVKKANELMPTMMIISFTKKADNGEEIPMPTTAIIGIKAKLYPVSANEIINRIRSKNQDNNWLNKFVRATTNELSFVKDFLFAIDKAKFDALNYSKKSDSAKIWRILERRSKKSKLRQALKMPNDASAISTLLVSQDLVEFLKKNDNIDIENPRTANAIMTSYNFMSIAVCDEAVEVAKFIYDTGDDMYETISFNHLERESTDGAYKKVINLMSKMR